jgi:DNA-directed RNA polymerase subunit RPC12/RpoP
VSRTYDELIPELDGHLVVLSKDAIDRYTMLEAYTLMQQLQAFIGGAKWPELVVTAGPDSDPEDPEDPYFRCPHCGALERTVNAEDTAWRTTELETNWDRQTVHSDYTSDHGEFQGLVYSCQTCNRPVNLPDGWEEL